MTEKRPNVLGDDVTGPRGVALLVEDDIVLSNLLSLILEQRGFHVDTATDGCDALEKLKVRHPDVIVTDLMMPTMDGWAFLETVRAEPRTRDIPVIVTSAQSPQARPHQAPVFAHLCKPFDVDELFTALEEVASTSRQ